MVLIFLCNPWNVAVSYANIILSHLWDGYDVWSIDKSGLIKWPILFACVGRRSIRFTCWTTIGLTDGIFWIVNCKRLSALHHLLFVWNMAQLRNIPLTPYECTNIYPISMSTSDPRCWVWETNLASFKIGEVSIDTSISTETSSPTKN
jgi:hypothetical protein